MLGKKVYLAELREGDTELLAEWQWDPQFMRGISDDVFHPFGVDDWEDMFGEPDSNEAFFFTIRQIKNDALVGFISLTGVMMKNRLAVIGIGIPHESYRGKGYGKEAVSLLLAYAFDHLGLHKVRLHVHSFNQNAIEMYRSLGFVQEGINRESVYQSGKWYDQLDFGFLQSEWRLLEETKVSRFKHEAR